MRKVGRVVGGLALILIGLVLALPLVPGPGIPLVAVGLLMISEDFPWAKRIVDWGREKWQRISERFLKKQRPGGAESP